MTVAELITAAEHEVDRAKREPAHSPVEDRLIDALDFLLEAVKQLERKTT